MKIQLGCRQLSLARNRQVVLYFLAVTLLSLGTSCSSFQTGSSNGEKFDIDQNQAFVDWLVEFIPMAYPGTEVVKHEEAGGKVIWYQAKPFIGTEQQKIISWWQGDESQFPLRAVTGLYPEKALFIGTTNNKGWTDGEYYPGIGYYLSAYDESVHGDWNIGGAAVVQIEGDDGEFVDKIVEQFN